MDVLRNYTTIDSWYKIMKTVEDDPMFDKKRAQKKLRAFVEGNPVVIAKKAAMMVEHFHEQVIAKKKLGGKARAMIVTASIPRCVEYYYAINKCLSERHSPYKTIVAFSGEHKYNGAEYVMPGTERKAVTYDFSPRDDLMMVAEDPAPYSTKKKDE